jgi:hypothetical protein
MGNLRMRPKRLRGFLHGRIIDPEVARDTTINDAKAGVPDLPDTDRDRFYAGREGLNQSVIRLLNPLPLTEVILERGDGKDGEKEQA